MERQRDPVKKTDKKWVSVRKARAKDRQRVSFSKVRQCKRQTKSEF